MSDASQGLSAAERKRLQRSRDKSRGYVEIVVRIPEDRADEVRSFCAKLAPRELPKAAGQLKLFGES